MANIAPELFIQHDPDNNIPKKAKEKEQGTLENRCNTTITEFYTQLHSSE